MEQGVGIVGQKVNRLVEVKTFVDQSDRFQSVGIISDSLDCEAASGFGFNTCGI